MISGRQRECWIDWVKSFAIYAVVLGHVVTSENDTWVKCLTAILTSCHVPLFFFVSGYLFRIKVYNFANYLQSNAKSLLIPYLFFNIVSASILWKLQSPEVFRQGFIDFMVGAGHSFAGPAWFLVALFFVRILAYWIENIGNVYIRLSVVGVLVSLANLPFIEDVFCIHWTLVNLLYFQLGKETERYKGMKYAFGLPFPIRFCVGVLCTIIVCIMLYVDGGLFLDFTCSYPTAYIYLRRLFAVVAVVFFCMFLNKCNNKIVKTISVGSIVIMGLHMTIIQCLWAIKDKIPTFFHFMVDTPFISVISFVLSIGCAIILKKYTPFLIGNRT